jgi:hypothetical protein
MTELVDQNEHGKPDAKPRAVERPVNRREGREAQQELELQKREEEFAFE